MALFPCPIRPADPSRSCWSVGQRTCGRAHTNSGTSPSEVCTFPVAQLPCGWACRQPLAVFGTAAAICKAWLRDLVTWLDDAWCAFLPVQARHCNVIARASSQLAGGSTTNGRSSSILQPWKVDRSSLDSCGTSERGTCPCQNYTLTELTSAGQLAAERFSEGFWL